VTDSCVLRETILKVVRSWSARFSIYLSIYLSYLSIYRSICARRRPQHVTQPGGAHAVRRGAARGGATR
jgi:hypothetical protein